MPLANGLKALISPKNKLYHDFSVKSFVSSCLVNRQPALNVPKRR